ncbi:MAG TPA: MFS transporter [Burkholderiales bacterium]|jgi:PPP family 3-phenylpropionic acid transporter|nr:MFS transporter [Burkholderiales bacterium]
MRLPLRLSVFYFAHFAHVGIFVAYFPLYLAWRGLGAVEIAWVLALPQAARIVAPAAWGWLADRTGAQRGIVVFCCAATVGGFGLLPVTTSFSAIAWLVALTSLLSAGALPLVEALTLGSLAGQPGRYGPIRLWGSVGFIATVLAGGAWLDLQPVSTLAFGLVTFAAGALVVALLLPPSTPHARQPAYARLRLTRPIAAILGAGFCMAVAHGALYAFLTLHLRREGYSGTSIGAFWTLGVLAEIVVFLCLPALFRRFSLSAILAASFLCAALRFLALGWLAGMAAVVVLAQLLHAASFGSFHAASVAAVQRVFPEAAQARGQALYSGVTYGAGGAAGALAAGWAWETAGPGFAFSLSALAALAGLLLAHALKRAGL